MKPALQKTLTPATGLPERQKSAGTDKQLKVTVIFTTVQSTLSALKKAETLAVQLGARITLVVPQIVPFPLPLESPPVLLDWTERRYRLIAEKSPVETTIRLYFGRDRLPILRQVLTPRSLVVIGGRKRWGPSWEKGLARQLRRAGHEVIFVETE